MFRGAAVFLALAANIAFRTDVTTAGHVLNPSGRPLGGAVPVTVWIVKKEDGVPIREPSTVPGLLTDANKILWQSGLVLVQSGQCRLLNNTNWLHHTDVLNPANTNLAAMLDTTNSMGNAVELYFVETLDGTDVAGVCWPKGIAIAAIGDGHTLAHEVMHDCGLEDIYTVEDPDAPDPNPVSGPVSEERIPADWGGGYYPPGLTQRELITRLLMRGGGFGPEPSLSGSIYLPRGTVYGWRYAEGDSVRTLGNVGVGLSAIRRNPGSY
jgi:hypothetical protein